MDTTDHTAFSIAICEDSFNGIFHSYYQVCYTYATRLVQNNELARDIVQDVFLKLWKNKERIQIQTSLRAYLLRMTHNQCLDTLRNGKHAADNISEINNAISRIEIIALDADDPVFDILYSEELQARFSEALTILPEQCRKIFNMNRQDGMSYLEISQQLGIAHSTVRNQMMLAMRKLYEELKLYL